jgi:hypothetical protein
VQVRWRQDAGPAGAVLRAQVPGAGWDRSGREGTVVQLWLDGSYHQDVILVGGEEETSYERLLGELPEGVHELEVRPHPGAPPRPAPRFLDLSAAPLHPRDAEEAFAWQHAPWIYTRAEADPWESLWTDTPLLLFYRITATGVEYQCVFSNEDAGTDTRGLLAQWGRTSDIEWVLRVSRGDGPATIQGRDHVTEVHRGTCWAGRRTLQVVGLHGMVSSEPPWGVMRCLFLPRFRWDPALPREVVMDAHPWTYRLAALEVEREGKLRPGSPPEVPEPGDLRDYVYVQLLRQDEGPGACGLEVRALLADGRSYSSTHGDRRLACRRQQPFSTTVKLPPGQDPVALEAVAHPPRSAGGVHLRLFKAFRLDGTHRPLPPFAVGEAVTLAPGQERVRLWTAGGPAGIH